MPGYESVEPSDLPLAALRYLLDEMSPQEKLRFEQLLASGGPACDALANVVQIQQALVVTSPRPLPASLPSDSPQRKSGLLAGSVAAAALLLAGVMLFVRPYGNGQAPPAAADTAKPRPPVPARHLPAAERLASVADVWASVRYRDPATQSLENELLPECDLLSDSAAEVHVPDWILVAVGAARSGGSESKPMREHRDHDELNDLEFGLEGEQL